MAYYPPWEGDVQYDYSYYGNQEQTPQEAQYYPNNPPAAPEYDYGDTTYANENEYPQQYNYQDYPYEDYSQGTYQPQQYEQPPATYYPNEYQNTQYPGYSDPYYHDYPPQDASMLQASADPGYYQSQTEYDLNGGYYADDAASQSTPEVEGRTAHTTQRRTCSSPAETGRAAAKTTATRRTSEQNSTRNARTKKGESAAAAPAEATRAQKPRKPPEANARAQTTSTATQKAAATTTTARSKAPTAAHHPRSPSRSPPPAASRSFKPARIPSSDAILACSTQGAHRSAAIARCHTSSSASPKRSYPATPGGGIPAPYNVRAPDRPPAPTATLGHAGSAPVVEHQRPKLKETPKLTTQDMGRIKKIMDVSSRYMKPHKRLTPSQERLARNASGDAATSPIIVSNLKQDGKEPSGKSVDAETTCELSQTAQEHRTLQRIAMERPRHEAGGGPEARKPPYSSGAAKEKNSTQIDVLLRDRTKAVYEKIAKEKMMRERRHVVQEMSHKAKERKPSTVPLAAAERTLLTLKTARGGTEVPAKKVASSDGGRQMGGPGEEPGDAGGCLPRIEELPSTDYASAPAAAAGHPQPRVSRSDPRFVTPK